MRDEQRPPAGARAIELTRGWVAWVSRKDYVRLNRVNWNVMIHIGGMRAYAVRHLPGGPSGSIIYMHKAITGTDASQHVDHVSHRLAEARVVDNRRSNLRLCTSSQNSANSRSARGVSIFKGVALSKSKSKPWRAYITRNGRQKNLGCFSVEAHAALARDVAAVKMHGKHALTNFPIPGSVSWLYEEGY